MTDYFFDSSGLVKRYVTEAGSLWVTEVIDNPDNRILVARITEAESNSAFARLVREKLWTTVEATLQRKQLHHHFHHKYSVIGINVAVVEQAIEFLHGYPLRTYDAIQLACATLVNTRFVQELKAPITFVSGDQRLLAVASAVGLPIEDPNVYP